MAINEWVQGHFRYHFFTFTTFLPILLSLLSFYCRAPSSPSSLDRHHSFLHSSSVGERPFPHSSISSVFFLLHGREPSPSALSPSLQVTASHLDRPLFCSPTVAAVCLHRAKQTINTNEPGWPNTSFIIPSSVLQPASSSLFMCVPRCHSGHCCCCCPLCSVICRSCPFFSPPLTISFFSPCLSSSLCLSVPIAITFIPSLCLSVSIIAATIFPLWSIAASSLAFLLYRCCAVLAVPWLAAVSPSMSTSTTRRHSCCQEHSLSSSSSRRWCFSSIRSGQFWFKQVRFYCRFWLLVLVVG